MPRLNQILAKLLIHLSCVIAGLVVAFITLDLSTPSKQASWTYPEGDEVQDFYLLLVQQAWKFEGKGLDSEFQHGMTADSQLRFESLINTIHYKEDCSQRTSWISKTAHSCYVNGETLEFVDYGS